jgi:uncharacterized membrane protein SirB2
MQYPLLLTIHISTVTFTTLLFLVRWGWALFSPARLQQRWVKIVPHVNDTLLLCSGLGMAYWLRQYPFMFDWLTAKFFALLFYISFGSIALKRGRNRRQKGLAGLAALICLGYLISVAVTRSPMPWR